MSRTLIKAACSFFLVGLMIAPAWSGNTPIDISDDAPVLARSGHHHGSGHGDGNGSGRGDCLYPDAARSALGPVLVRGGGGGNGGGGNGGGGNGGGGNGGGGNGGGSGGHGSGNGPGDGTGNGGTGPGDGTGHGHKTGTCINS